LNIISKFIHIVANTIGISMSITATIWLHVFFKLSLWWW